ncbi:MAG: EF-P lysine aminoacylase GenX [Planctomycetaceae bacterium]|nr:EF-P lysine aminoacylase GenX [Planctomycetaceae bacterium]
MNNPRINSVPMDQAAPDSAHDFTTTATLETLKRRSEVLRQIRDFFYQHQFWEVETPVLSQESVIDLYLDPFEVSLPFPDNGVRFLQTSPEFGMKRLLASGADAIFQITKAFRAGEVGQHHNPEFTMLEWYRCGDNYNQGRQFLAEFIETWFTGPCEQTTYQTLFLQWVGLDPWSASTAMLLQKSSELGYVAPTPGQESDDDLDCLTRRNALHFLWNELVEPHLGFTVPTIVYDWPASESALARTGMRRDFDGQTREVAERFELYVNGIELANGYHELLDATVLRERNDSNNIARGEIGKSKLPENRRLLAAMHQGFPACCGVALGVDRLLMTILNKSAIAEVITFPWDRA